MALKFRMFVVCSTPSEKVSVELSDSTDPSKTMARFFEKGIMYPKRASGKRVTRPELLSSSTVVSDLPRPAATVR